MLQKFLINTKSAFNQAFLAHSFGGDIVVPIVNISGKEFSILGQSKKTLTSGVRKIVFLIPNGSSTFMRLNPDAEKEFQVAVTRLVRQGEGFATVMRPDTQSLHILFWKMVE